MSNIDKMKEISHNLAEPEWLLLWRNARALLVETLPKTLKYGIGITGVLPAHTEESPLALGEDFPLCVDYHVDASKGLELHTWKEAVTQEEVAPILEGLLKSEFFPKATNYYGGLAQAFFRSGLVVYVQPSVGEGGMLKEEKLVLDTLVPKGSSADIIVVIAKEGAKLSFVSALSGGDEKSTFSRTVIVLTERDAEVRITQKQTLVNGATLLLSSRGIVAAHSSITWNQIFSGDIAIKSETEDMLIGEFARGEIREGIVANGLAKYDIYSSVRHLADHTHSRIRTTGIGVGTSKIIYRGVVDMAEGVHTVDGGQEAKFLLLSPNAEIDAIPSLDIASKDVLCTHKLSISHIRDADTFYPKLRGLSDSESRALFLECTFAEVFSGEENEEIMREISEYIRKSNLDT
ncbi:MAG TPA: SufD family Fe-S cluster assembly protein [Candidatus Paceibacterota bacterium]